MEQKVVIKYRWTVDEVQQAHHYHFRHTCRPLFRVGLHCSFVFVLLGGVLMLVTSGSSGKAPLSISLGFVAAGSYWFVLRPFDRRWRIRRQFEKRPDRDLEIEWEVSDDRIIARSELGQSEIAWRAFAKVVFTPSGVMLYPNDQLYQWVPRHGFAGAGDFERFAALARIKIPRHYEVA